MLKEKLFESKNIASFLSLFALLFAYIGAYTYCVFIFHQPEKPDFSKLRNF
ncbi:MAG: cyclic lactone autoinducer peptide [Lachnospiraceae bacterium]